MHSDLPISGYKLNSESLDKVLNLDLGDGVVFLICFLLIPDHNMGDMVAFQLRV